MPRGNFARLSQVRLASPYDSFRDPYCYKNSFVLKNRAGLRDAVALERLEGELSTYRVQELLPSGRFDPKHYRAVHHHLFQDIYRWAGRYRARAGSARTP